MASFAKTYLLPHYRLLEDPSEVAGELAYLANRPGILVCYDTETTGLRPWLNQQIVMMMFRYTHPDTGEPIAFGFPWDYAASPIKPHIEQLTPLVLQVLAVSKLVGHNLTFDMLFTHVALGRTEEYQLFKTAKSTPYGGPPRTG
jgi:hypothetical protein